MSEAPINVVAAVFFRKNHQGFLELMLFRRAKNNSGAGFWEFPGGKVETGESEVQALQREILEELAVQIKVLKLVGHNVHRYSDKVISLQAYLVEQISSNTFQFTDHDSFGWFDNKSIKLVSVSPADIPLIDRAFALAEMELQ
jgi:8-oxo-dGTP diphosphatase